MFLHVLNDEQRKVFGRIALYVMGVDDVVDLREEEALDRALREVGWGRGDLPAAPRTPSEAFLGLEAFASRESKAVLLFEAANLVVADARVDAAENRALRVLAARLGLPETLRERCVEVAYRGRRLREEAQGLIWGDW